jgi:hypothetical protein
MYWETVVGTIKKNTETLIDASREVGGKARRKETTGKIKTWVGG